MYPTTGHHIYPEYGGSVMVLIGKYLSGYIASCLRKQQSSSRHFLPLNLNTLFSICFSKPTKYVFINIGEDQKIKVFLAATQSCEMKHPSQEQSM
jgi:hypothetical protein